jgi:Protein of unknown function (DUF2950)
VAVAGAVVVVVGAVAAVVGDRRSATMTHSNPTSQRTSLIAALAILIPFLATSALAQKRFATPEEAVRVAVAAAGKDDEAAMRDILGPGSEDVVSSGDPIADHADRQRAVAAAKERTHLETLDSGAVIVHFGKDDWPYPIPLVKDGDGWRFDTAAGRDELLNRRIGRNELKTLGTCRALVDAQREYASRERIAGAGRAYAQKVRSDPGKRDGLYWDDPTGKEPSPFGPHAAEAATEGYMKPEAGAAPRPFHGYYYRILTAQGAHAPEGARSYLKDGHMTGGFALVAYPADYGASGVMTFIVDRQGVVYQKNLGEKTEETAKAMAAYDPDESWTPVRD